MLRSRSQRPEGFRYPAASLNLFARPTVDGIAAIRMDGGALSSTQATGGCQAAGSASAIGCASAVPVSGRCGVRLTADPHPKPLIQPCLGLAETQREGTTNQTHQGMELVEGVLVEQRRQLCLRCSGGLNPGPLLDGGLAELRVPRPIRSRGQDNTVAKTLI
jgi:hypothetical protein